MLRLPSPLVSCLSPSPQLHDPDWGVTCLWRVGLLKQGTYSAAWVQCELQDNPRFCCYYQVYCLHEEKEECPQGKCFRHHRCQSNTVNLRFRSGSVLEGHGAASVPWCP